MTLTLYTNPMSRGQIAHWMLEELGEVYETVWLEFGETGTKRADYLALNPMGKVPTVVHDQRSITEAAAICLYLAETFPKAKLLPPPDRRADYYRWTFFAAGPLEHAVTSRALGWEAADRSTMLGFGTFDATIATLSGHLAQNSYICGESFTAADVYVGSAVEWGLLFKTIPSSAVLEAYASRVSSRPARRRTKAIYDEKIAQKRK